MGVVINYDTGEIVRGKIEPPPVEFMVKRVLIPFKQWNDGYLKRKAESEGQAKCLKT